MGATECTINLFKQYTTGFKARMVKRMAGAERISARALGQEVGVCQSTLSKWLREAGTVAAMGGSHNRQRGGEDGKADSSKARRPQEWSPVEKLRAVVEASRLSEAELGEFLRSKGLHAVHLEEWRAAAELALTSGGKTRQRGKPSEGKRIKALERELNRKDKALAEVTALLVLKKKLEAIWGDEDESTRPKNET